MTTTLFSSILALFAVSFSSFYVFFISFKRRGFKSDFYAFLWLMIAVIVGLIGARTIFFALGFPHIDKFIAYLVQISVALAICSFGFFLSKKLKIGLSRVLSAVFVLLGLIFFIFLFIYGIGDPLISDWGTEYSASFQANIFLFIAGGTAIVLLFIDFIGIVFDKKTNNAVFRRNLLINFSLIWFVIIGILEQQGSAGWQVLFFRILWLISPLIAFFTLEEIE